jgi:hypothetical protein
LKKTKNAWDFSIWDKFEMKNIYRNYNEEDLIVAYLSMVDHTGKINDEMREAISQKFDYNEFVKKANFRKALIKEKGRISFEVHNRVQKGDDFNVIESNISSEILTKRELEHFIIENTINFHPTKKIIQSTKEFTKAFWVF